VIGEQLVSPNAETVVFVACLKWRPEDAVSLRFFVGTLIDDDQATAAFTAPRPAQPDGWAWDAEARRWVEA
jgi:hypothetical protein